MPKPLAKRIRAIAADEFNRMERDAGNVTSELLHLFHDHVAGAMRSIGVLMAAPDYRDESWRRQLYTLSHDLKGLGGSFGYDLITIVGESLCKLIGHKDLPRDPALQRRVAAHIVALKAIIEVDLKSRGGSDGAAMLAALEISNPRN